MPKDPYAFDEDDDGEDSGKPAPTAEELLKERNRLGKQNRDLLKELTSLKEFQTQVMAKQREDTLSAAFVGVGLDPKLSKLYALANPEADPTAVNEQAILAFASSYGFAVVDEGGKPVQTQEPPIAPPAAPAAPESGFNPLLGASGESKPVGAGKISTTDLAKLMKENPAEADRMVNEGLVELPQAQGVELIWKTK
jgi:hypothetical protein